MPVAAALIFLGCLFGHVAVAGVSSSPWWVPNLTLVGLVLAVAHAPHRWRLVSVCAGLAAAVWAVRIPQGLVLNYLLIGWGVQRFGRQWDISLAHLQRMVVGAASAALTAALLWYEGMWSWTILGLAGVHVAVTVACVPVAQKCLSSLKALRGFGA